MSFKTVCTVRPHGFEDGNVVVVVYNVRPAGKKSTFFGKLLLGITRIPTNILY